MELPYGLILVASLVQFVLGAMWYSPLIFGKWWMQIMELNKLSKEEMQKMQKTMMPFYVVQLAITLLFTFVLAMFLHYLRLGDASFHAYGVAGWVWLGFVAPTQIAGVIWGNTKKKFWCKQLFIMLSYQLVALMITAFILSM